ncbi:protein I'm not dead yet-like isoform X2 [Armigeres subalbatus]|uniref:protein I'm not dead yet-like isoform X2 n=1 Tax=Armigeres subalbatus TaxID=124917 RepID=UPI002ED106D5
MFERSVFDLQMSETTVPDDTQLGCCKRALQFVNVYWRTIFVLLVPTVASMLFLVESSPAFRCLYVVIVMGLFWVTEALPLPITSMLPIVLFPLMGILSTGETCKVYMEEPVMMFIGGIVLALAIEHCNLHKRVALKVISLIGCSQRKLHFGLMIVAMFLSMWISNTAAVAMMCPIVQAVLQELESQGLCQMYESDESIKGKTSENKDEHKKPSQTTICYLLGTAYASSIGGCGTLIGTGTNLTFKGVYENRFPEANGINFPDFMFFSVPLMLLDVVLVWAFLQWHFMGLFSIHSEAAKQSAIGREGEAVAKRVIETRYQEMGPMKSDEISVALLFILSIMLFFTRSPGFISGWSDIFPDVKIKDATPAIMIVIVLFIVPSDWRWLAYFKTNSGPLPTEPSPALITWKYVNQKLHWGLIFLLGGGFALAEAGQVTGMSALLGESLSGLQSLPPLATLFVVCLVTTMITEFTSNVAVSNIILPVLAEMAIVIKIHPLYLMLPATMCCSYAFHMPVGTPGNAIVAGAGHIRIKDMALAGIGPALITLLVMWVGLPTWGVVVYPEINTFPDWAIHEMANVSLH